MLRILIEDSEGKSKLAPINPEAGEVTIGRKEGNTIRLKERNVSRYHARIYNTPEGLFVEPVAARYGLKLNSSKIDGPTPLALGDEIRIGDFRLYLQDESAPQVAKPEETDEVVDIDTNLQPRFVVISSNFAGVEYYVRRSKVVIGRDPACDIAIHHQSVSSRHAEVRRTPRGDYEIRDLNSSNGTKVNGIPISEPFKLDSGDAVTLGHVTMRYCGPGDFWSLNFGINDAPKQSNPYHVMFVGAAILIVLMIVGALLYKSVSSSNTSEPSAPGQPATSANVEVEVELNQQFKSYNDFKKVGDFELAEQALKRARELAPDDPRVRSKEEELKKESKSKKALEAIKKALNDDKCRDAEDELASIEFGTYAESVVEKDKLKVAIKDCLDKKAFRRALDSLQNGDIEDAETVRNDIRERNIDSPYLDKLEEEIRKAKATAARNSAGSGGAKKNTTTGNKPAEAPDEAPAAPPKPQVSAAEYCQKAAAAKIGANKDVCKSLQYYKKAREIGGLDPNCEKAAKMAIQQYAGKCVGK